MKKYLTCAVTVFFAAIAVSFGDDKATCMANENAAWQAYKDKKPDDFKKVVDKDIRVVGADGINNMQKELDGMKEWLIKSFTISDWDAFSDEKDVIVATYKVTLSGTANGKDISGTYNSGTVWKKEGADWLAVFHAAAKAEPVAAER